LPPIIQKHLIHLIKQLWVLSFKATRRYFKCFIIILSLWFLKKCSVGACEQGLEVVNTAANNKKFCQTFFLYLFFYLSLSLTFFSYTNSYTLSPYQTHTPRQKGSVRKWEPCLWTWQYRRNQLVLSVLTLYCFFDAFPRPLDLSQSSLFFQKIS